MLAGDTDTNAVIVGGMIGAFLDKKGIKNNFIEQVLNCKHEEGTGRGRWRPKEVNPAYSFLKLLAVIIEKCPSQMMSDTRAPT